MKAPLMKPKKSTSQKKLTLTPAPPEFEPEALALITSDAAFADAASVYASFILVPPILAQRLRARGDDRACRRDFDCPCFTSPATDRPYCDKFFANCRFAGDVDSGHHEKRQPTGCSPRYRIFHDALYAIAFAYSHASALERAGMLAFMTRATDRHERLIQKHRSPGGANAQTPA